MVEIIGIIATVFLVLSFVCTGERHIRIVNSIGAMLFVFYGLIIGAWSTALSNFLIIAINVYKLLKGE